MIYALLADAVPPDLRAELTGVVILLVVAVLKAVLSHFDAKQAAAKATTEAEKAAAAKVAEKAEAERAAAVQKGLDALALYFESQKKKLPEPEQKRTSTAIRAFTEAMGVEPVVAATVQRLGLSSKSRPEVATPKEAS